MRLLHSKTLELLESSDGDAIIYAIFSHTWGNEEILFQDIQGLNLQTIPAEIKEKAGYKKIQACCAQAERDGFDYVWVDTCCIDKRSSAELSEAINSMYRWYQKSVVCYAYLEDVPNGVEHHIQKAKFKKSRWFKRGWTLQELIAPFAVEFYGDQWFDLKQKASLGTKRSLQNEIYEITKIPVSVLRGSGLQQYSIAQKMSWASHRETTRVEDRAYSLMGLFNVNMPLLYGERRRSFIRLQEEIMRHSDDESLFAWKGVNGHSYAGLLATSPYFFADSGDIDRRVIKPRTTPFAVTNKGLRLEFPLHRSSFIRECPTLETSKNVLEPVYVAVLNCVQGPSPGKLIGVPLGRLRSEETDTVFVRVDTKVLVLIDPTFYQCSGLSENIQSTIFAMLSAGSEQFVTDVRVWERRLDRMNQFTAIWIHTLPQNYILVACYSDKIEFVKDRFFLQFSPLRDAVPHILLHFDNGSTTFIIAIIPGFDSPRLQIQGSVPIEKLTEHLINLRQASWERTRGILGASGLPRADENGFTDKMASTLESGEVVSASVRPQKENGYFGFCVYISID